MPDARPRPPEAAPADPPAPARPEVTSAALLQGARELAIRHGGELYRLRLTSQDKLILTK